MMKQRVLPIVLLFILIVPMVLSACSSQFLLESAEQTAPSEITQPTATTANPSLVPNATDESQSVSEADAYLQALGAADYQGRVVNIAVYRSKNIFPSKSRDVIDDLALSRNEKVEKQYNVKLNEVAISTDNYFENLHKDVLSGTVSCDMVVAPVTMLDLFVTYSFYTNVNTLGIDFNAPYYDKEAMDALSTGAITYAVVGDYTASPEQAHCVFYNKRVIDSNALGDISALVKEGKWTWQAMMEYSAKATAKDAPQKIEYGISSSCDESEFIRMMWASSDVAFFQNVPPYKPALALEDTVVDPIVKLIKNVRTASYYYGADEKNQMQAIDSFRYGSTLFYISEIGDYSKLLNNEFSIGFAPLPKTDEAQTEYSTYTDNSFQAIFVLPNCPDLSLSSRMIQALNASSYRLVDNAYLNLYMHMYLSSNTEALMMRDIINRPYYDLAYLLDDAYSGGFSSVTTDMIYRVITRGEKFRTLYKKSETQFRRFLEDYRKTFDYLDGPPPSSTPAPSTTVPASTAAAVATTPPTAAKTTAKPKPPATTIKPTPAPATTKPKPTSAPVVTTKAPTTTAKPQPTVPVTTVAPTTTVPTPPATTVVPTTTPAPSTVPVTTVAPATSTAPVTTVPPTTVPAVTAPASATATVVPASSLSAS